MTAILHAIGTVVAGAYATARLSMTVPASMLLAGTHGTYELLDLEGRVWMKGEFDDLSSEASQVSPGQKLLQATVQVPIPSALPANSAGTQYQLRWTIASASGQPLYSFENFTVLPNTQEVIGASDAVELLGDTAGFQLVLPVEYTNVWYEIYQGNARLVQPRPAKAMGSSEAGYVYTGVSGPTELRTASLDPYNVSWSYWNGNADSPVKQRETTQLFLVTHTVLDAAKEVQNWLNRAFTDSGIQPGTTFDIIDYIKYLRTGRDRFNASDKPTMISFLNAQGPFRWFWIGFACVAAARAQYLAEGMKAFNFSGQVTQLDTDRTQYWQTVGDNIEQALDQQIKPFKDNLMKYGITSGDGSNLALRPGAVGSIGVSIHGLSPIRGLYGLGAPFTPYQR